VALSREFDGADPIRPQSAGQELRRIRQTGHLATGTLACPTCDAPVAPGARPLSPIDALACPYCGHAGAVRDFLSLASPSRPARVEIRVVSRRRGEPAS
jgi:hypothetical protein